MASRLRPRAIEEFVGQEHMGRPAPQPSYGQLVLCRLLLAILP